MEWYHWLILALLTVAVVLAWMKALKAGKKRRERLKAETERLKRESELRRDFKVLTAELLKDTPDERLLAGVAMSIQLPLEKEADMTVPFKELPREKQYIYTLEYFVEDCEKSLSNFLRCNGQPLIGLAPEALRAVGLDEAAATVSEMLPMLDDNDEETSFDSEKCERLDAEFAKIYNPQALLAAAADYIKKNQNIFIYRED